ncbi:MAG: hypothetical protein H6679_02345 [Epsilonproteobacteria bacterium]|nr:hypothetical protein [Campylobacterota bacterium]
MTKKKYLFIAFAIATLPHAQNAANDSEIRKAALHEKQRVLKNEQMQAAQDCQEQGVHDPRVLTVGITLLLNKYISPDIANGCLRAGLESQYFFHDILRLAFLVGATPNGCNYKQLGGYLKKNCTNSAHSLAIKKVFEKLDIKGRRPSQRWLDRMLYHLVQTELHPEIVEKLLRWGANPNCQKSRSGNSTLHVVYNKAIAELLLKYGANPTLRNKHWWTPLETLHKRYNKIPKECSAGGNCEAAKLLHLAFYLRKAQQDFKAVQHNADSAASSQQDFPGFTDELVENIAIILD